MQWKDFQPLRECPFCGGEADIFEASEDSFCALCTDCGVETPYQTSTEEAIAAWNRRAQPEITGETSDGYHTFNELYHHRAVLFSVICNDSPTQAWKSKLHHDGTMYDGMFIVGINTPEGQATYHYDIDPYWDMFKVQELPNAPEWDGHTPAQAIKRIGKLSAKPENKPLSLKDICKELEDYRLSKTASHFATIRDCENFRAGIKAAIEIIQKTSEVKE